MEGAEAKARIRSKAKEMGFDAVGFCSAAGDAGDRQNLAQFLAEGRHGDMSWMETNVERRADPQVLWPPARTIIMLGLNYGPRTNPGAAPADRSRGAISVYARGQDYHKVVKKRLKELGGWIASSFDTEVRIFVDTAPIMEKPAAMRSGIGWIGKHTNLVSRRFGSWLFLGEVFTALDLPPDQPEVDHCGTCDRCVRACPTDALKEPYRIDARRCLSYITIEHRGDVEPALADAAGNHIYGCDDCLAVCPWNRFSAPTPHAELDRDSDAVAPPLVELAQLDDAAFRQRFAGTAMKRTGRDRFVRNVLLALGNCGNPSFAEVVRQHRDDASAPVRNAAAHALNRLKDGGT